jgi:hypothetical protein
MSVKLTESPAGVKSQDIYSDLKYLYKLNIGPTWLIYKTDSC